MLVIVAHDRFVDVVKPTWLTRIGARVFRSKLDADLSLGADPDATVLHSLRAQLLIAPRRRRALARSLRRELQSSPGHTPGRFGYQVTGAPRGVVAAVEPELRAIIDILERPGLVTPRGMALVNLLVMQGAGPLHFGNNAALLRNRCREAIDRLRPI
jgi:hypothetical protein